MAEGVVGQIDLEGGAHLGVRIVGRGVADHGDVVAELGGEPHRRLHAGMRDQAHDDDLLDAVALELQIQIGVGETAGTPVLVSDDVTGLRFEPGTDLAAPGAVFERLARPGGPLHRRDVLPRFVVARPVTAMQGIKDAEVRAARRVEHLLHVGDAAIAFDDAFQPVPHLPVRGNEVVVGVDHQEPGRRLVVCHRIIIAHGLATLTDSRRCC
ncbi:hypothetical protein MINTM003_04870 [Mycobacterium paraintracellulare]|nr:hypothetical protein MINTM003_04870 [Mycobacterium paraintracellulare]BCO87233.1 hypothetical protein MINTM015_04900 [Mycobacterium paraintracellulare]